MIITAAQTVPKKKDILENLNDHYKLIQLAADNGAQLIVFPELSLTGYQREEAVNLFFDANDSRLDRLKELAADKNMIIIVGAPIKQNSFLYIGSFIVFPDKSILIYTKQFLHTGEEDYFVSSFDYNPQIKLEDENISLAICADIENPLHAENASKSKSTLYIASIFYTPKGISEAHTLLSEYAKKYSMAILMSNYGGSSWEMESGGQSAFWSNTGEMIAKFNGIGEGLIIMKKETNFWTGKTIKLK